MEGDHGTILKSIVDVDVEKFSTNKIYALFISYLCWAPKKISAEKHVRQVSQLELLPQLQALQQLREVHGLDHLQP